MENLLSKLPNIALTSKPLISKAVGISHIDTTGYDVIVITGENASGKSLVRRLFTQNLSLTYKIDKMMFSQEHRTSGGIPNAMIYGTEDYESTGAISAKVIVGGFRNCELRDDKDGDVVLIYDEPEIGLGEEAQLGVGVYMRNKMQNECPDKLMALIVFTHSKHIVSELMQITGKKLLFVNLTYNNMTSSEWINRVIKPITPDEVNDKGHEKYHEIQQAINHYN